jgi:hydrogen peroxide-dependent heme synthase
MINAPAKTTPSAAPRAFPPETLEGWYALHQIFSVDPAPSTSALPTPPAAAAPSPDAGWSAYARLIGSAGDLMAMHFRATLDDIGVAQRSLSKLSIAPRLRLRYSFLSVTEAGLYHLTAQLAREAAERGGTAGDEAYTTALSKRILEERDNPHVRRRLYPAIPDGMPYVSFYPMSKRRAAGQNWYGLSLDERRRLMQTHGMTGRRYAGRVLQVITGAIGFDAWEWGVTLFAKDPLDFKKLVTDMRFDEVSAQYAEFGEFYVGKLVPEGDLERTFETI